MGFRGLLLEPDEARAAGAAALGFPLLTAVPDDLDDSTDLVLTDHHRSELGVILRDALATKARWIGIMGNPHHVGPHVAMLTELGVPPEEIARVHRPIGLNIGSRIPAGDRHLHPGRPARRPQRPPWRFRVLTQPPLPWGIHARSARLNAIAGRSLRRRLRAARSRARLAARQAETSHSGGAVTGGGVGRGLRLAPGAYRVRGRGRDGRSRAALVPRAQRPAARPPGHRASAVGGLSRPALAVRVQPAVARLYRRAPAAHCRPVGGGRRDGHAGLAARRRAQPAAAALRSRCPPAPGRGT